MREDYTRFAAVCFGLSVAILGSFQVYIAREPARIAAVEANDKAISVGAGQTLFEDNCVLCHGDNGLGDSAPALNDKTFLESTDDDTIFSVINSGIPGTEMPAWNVAHGGLMTDEDVRHVVAYLRSWQPTAKAIREAPPNGNSDRGKKLFATVCAVCHGEDGAGTDSLPAMNDAKQLSQFDDAWYRDAIANGRPATGMPTWGTVLSPQEISDLVAMIDVWRHRAGVDVSGPTPMATATVPPTSTAP